MMSYDYTTRHITRDFVLVKTDDICRFSGLPARVGNQRCMKCQYFSTKIYAWQYGNILDDSTFVCCKCKEQKDSNDCTEALSYLYRKFEYHALCALDE